MDQSLTSSTGSSITAVNVGIEQITGDMIIVNYQTPSGNMPAAYKNTIYILPAYGNYFPYGTSNKPIATYQIPDNVPMGTAAIRANILVANSYILGYAVGPALQSPAELYGNVCATVFIPPSGEDFPAQHSNLSITYVSPTVVSATYMFGQGTTPAVNGAWVGLWQGQNMLYNIPPMASQAITQNTPTGNVALNAQLMRGAIYTLGLFTSGWGKVPVQTTLAVACTFNT